MTNTPKPAPLGNRDKMMTSELLTVLIERVDWLLGNHIGVQDTVTLIDEFTKVLYGDPTAEKPTGIIHVNEDGDIVKEPITSPLQQVRSELERS